MSTYTKLKSRGDKFSSTKQWYLYIYPDTTAEKGTCEYEIPNALENCADQHYNWGSLGYYEININYDYPYINNDVRSEQKDNFELWLDGKGYDRTGVHINVSDNFSGGKADPGDRLGGTAFSTDKSAVVGTNSSTAYFKNIAIMEALHPCINKYLDNVESMIDNGDEHELGVIYNDEQASPMTSGYGSDIAKHGDCNDNYSYNGHTTTMTECTKDAFKYTVNEET